jgi:serine/threonine protein kinase
VIHGGGFHVTPNEIQNETRAIKKLCTGHPHIVDVLDDGDLPNSPFYFIDMELCSLNLHEYIYGNPGSSLLQVAGLMKSAPSSRKVTEIWYIMRQIASGLAFIHSHREVHRDLKPQNSKSVSHHDSDYFSPFFYKGLSLENCGFWVDKRRYNQHSYDSLFTWD